MATMKNKIRAAVNVSAPASSQLIDDAIATVAKATWGVIKAPAQVCVMPAMMWVLREEIAEMAEILDAEEAMVASEAILNAQKTAKQQHRQAEDRTEADAIYAAQKSGRKSASV
jgi:hypothetical protein